MSYAAAPSAGSGTAPGRAGYSNRPPSGPVTSHPPTFPGFRASASARTRCSCASSRPAPARTPPPAASPGSPTPDLDHVVADPQPHHAVN